MTAQPATLTTAQREALSDAVRIANRLPLFANGKFIVRNIMRRAWAYVLRDRALGFCRCLRTLFAQTLAKVWLSAKAERHQSAPRYGVGTQFTNRFGIKYRVGAEDGDRRYVHMQTLSGMPLPGMWMDANAIAVRMSL